MITVKDIAKRFDQAIAARDKNAYEATRLEAIAIIGELAKTGAAAAERAEQAEADAVLRSRSDRGLELALLRLQTPTEAQREYDDLIETYNEAIDQALNGWTLAAHTDKTKEILAQAADTETERDEVLRFALSSGVPVARIMEWTGFSRSRVYQIRDGRR